MQLQTFPLSLPLYSEPTYSTIRNPNPKPPPPAKHIKSVLIFQSPQIQIQIQTQTQRQRQRHFLSSNLSNSDSITNEIDDDDGEDDLFFCETESRSVYREGGGMEIEVEEIGNNCRRIRSKIDVEASLQIVWDILTDYEGLAEFIPGLAVNQLIEKRDNFARLFQIGQQNLAFGLKFNAKGTVDCYEKDLVSLPSGQRRDIEFKMIDGDFKLFEGKWSIEQCSTGKSEQNDSLDSEEFRTTLSYVVDVEPKMWLPVRLVEGRICKEITMNLSCIREKAQRAYHDTLHPC